MKNIFKYGSYTYEYYIEFGDRRSLTLVVRPDLRIILRAPINATIDEIEAFLKRKWAWLEKQLAELKKYQKTHREKQHVSGEAFHYLGRQYMLEVLPAIHDDVKLERGKLRVYSTAPLRNSKHNHKLIDEWYDRRRYFIFRQEYNKALKLFSYVHNPVLRQRDMTRRWGSYTADNKVSLNPKLIEAPREAIYYVCVHELCHVMNRKHDQSFYDEIAKRIPNWRRVKEHLEINYG